MRPFYFLTLLSLWAWSSCPIETGLARLQASELAHPFHICIGEMEWNAKNGTWEVSLRLHPADLQKAVSRQAGKQVNIAVGTEEQPEVMAYLQSHFYLVGQDPVVRDPADRTASEPAANGSASPDATADSEVSRLKWLGSEMEKGWIWLYVELTPPRSTPPRSTPPLDLVHDLLVDEVDGQSNTMVFLHGEQRKTLRFTKENRRRAVPIAVDGASQETPVSDPLPTTLNSTPSLPRP